MTWTRSAGVGVAVWALACTSPTTSDTPAPTGDSGTPITDTGTPREVTDDFELVRAQLVDGIESVVRVVWNQPREGSTRVEYRTDPEAGWSQTPLKTVPRSTGRQVLLGVPYETEVEYRVITDMGDGEEVTPAATITTGAYPDDLPVPIVLASDPGKYDTSAPYVITSMNRDGDNRYGRWWVFIMNRAGQVVWAQQTPREWISRHVSVAFDNRALLVDRDTFWTDRTNNGATSTVVRMTLDGRVEHTYRTPGLHHAFTPIPDGEIAWGAKNGSNKETIEKVDLDGSQTEVWDCADLHAESGDGGTCGSNGLWWDARTDHFLFSFWSTDTVVEVDHASGEHLRYFGDMTGAWAFDPPATQFWWQHGPTYTPTGTLMVSTKGTDRASETLIREYELDEENKVLREVWSFGEGRGIYGPYMGEAHRLSNGNTLHVYGAGGHLAEAMPDGTVAWEVTWEGDKHNGRTTVWNDLYELVP